VEIRILVTSFPCNIPRLQTYHLVSPISYFRLRKKPLFFVAHNFGGIILADACTGSRTYVHMAEGVVSRKEVQTNVDDHPMIAFPHKTTYGMLLFGIWGRNYGKTRKRRRRRETWRGRRLLERLYSHGLGWMRRKRRMGWRSEEVDASSNDGYEGSCADIVLLHVSQIPQHTFPCIDFSPHSSSRLGKWLHNALTYISTWFCFIEHCSSNIADTNYEETHSAARFPML
jgi:hypothetical protein